MVVLGLWAVACQALPPLTNGMVLYFDASDTNFVLDSSGLPVTNGAYVMSWVDRSGFGRHAGQDASAKRPRFFTGQLGGQPVIRFDGSDDVLTDVSAAEIVRQSSGAPDTTVKVYDGLHHEIHNEPEQDQVLEDIVAWLDAHLG